MPKLILIVDDDVNFVNMIGWRLKAVGYDVIVAFDAISATKQALDRRPDLIILDLKLPAGGGCQVYTRLKTSINTALIPIMFATGFSKNDFPEIDRIEHFDEYLLTKPFKAEELLAKVREILEGPGEDIDPVPEEKDREFAVAHLS